MNIGTIAAFVLYMALMLGIGVYFFSKSKNISDYFLGGRQLGSWVTALSAQASDMSGWLLMGLPAAAYMSGISAGWIAIGLGVGTYLNWKIVASRLRRYTEVSGDSITIPEYLQNRFQSKSTVVRSICAVIIFVFFLIYTASAFNAGATLFEHLFGWDYTMALTVGAVIIIAYTFLGGFFAVCWTDFIQGMMMFVAIVVVPIVAMVQTPGFSVALLEDLGGQGFLSMVRGPEGSVPMTTIISSLAWGLGYFGMPHILTRFMAIKSSDLIKKSRIIAMVWVAISLTAAVAVGVFGHAYLSSIGVAYESSKAAEVVFMDLVTRLTPGFIAGVLLSAIMAAVMSTADSQLLVTASAVSNDFYKALFRKNASDKELMWVSRGAVIAIAVVAYIIALDPNNSVMGLVSYAWAGFGAAFGPVILLSLFWKRMTLTGAVAGMVSGGVTVLIWESLKLEAATGLYSLVPGFAIALALVIVVSLLTKAPSEEVVSQFEAVKKTELA
ncbi:sodium/proline symporter PutP [Clostridiaceae bacterium NSJ-31]|uniref:Sodium/proline symporter n=1 Tax=Ligaoa zhengdingensis TaxID=2763658 RepID=A0A926I2Z9_9FIRM|nr:sodium/proline symporter PutP [Ligaoa zhengdingensis]MBC8545824.1 sodium/proline symporter PutP [Ligaoa zhengdingensis]